MNVKQLILELQMWDDTMEVYRPTKTGVKPITKIDRYGLETKLVLEIS